jgi:serine/threonine protein kinase
MNMYVALLSKRTPDTVSADDDGNLMLMLWLQIADFGLTRAMAPSATHVSTASHGTVTHMPPELLMQGQLRPAADVYSFGIMGKWLKPLQKLPNPC